MRILMHGHHADHLFSACQSLEKRLREIEMWKPVEEQELRKALIKDVTGILPCISEWKACLRAGEACYAAEANKDRAEAVYRQQEARYTQAHSAFLATEAPSREVRGADRRAAAARKKSYRAFEAAVIACRAAERERDAAIKAVRLLFDVEVWHREHCHPRCPWNGKTIFAKGTNIKVLEE